MEEVLHLGKMGCEEPPVGPDRVAAEWHRSRLADMRSEECEGLVAGFGE